VGTIKEYDVLIIGSGTSKRLLDRVLIKYPKYKIAVIDKDLPGGICLTRGCVPSKFLMYPAEIIRTIEHLDKFGIEVSGFSVDFNTVMERMRNVRDQAVEMTLKKFEHPQIDFYNAAAKFVEQYTLKIKDEMIRGKKILLTMGSEPFIPPIKNIHEVGFLTSKTVFDLKILPQSLLIVGAGVIAAEMGHFFSAMGSKVTIIGRGEQFLQREDPDISKIALQSFSKNLTIVLGQEVIEAQSVEGTKILICNNKDTGDLTEFSGQEILLAAGNKSLSDVLHPEVAGIETTHRGWIKTNEFLETNQKNVWSWGDANGIFQLKHKANYETEIAFQNIFLGERIRADYSAIPHAIFSYPEIGAVSLTETQAISEFGKENILIGFFKFEETAKGRSMELSRTNYFAKVLVHKESEEILGGHIIGPHASLLIQEIITQMYNVKANRSYRPILGMHPHPALSQVVEYAFTNLYDVDEYHSL